jgi:tetratricopeptide (TPR) repeat protein
LARLYHRSGRLDEALSALAAGLEPRSDDLDAHLLNAVCLAHARRPRQAETALDRALGLALELPADRVAGGQRGPGSEEWGREEWAAIALAARALLDIRRPREACRHLELALSSRPDDPDLWLWLGLSRLRAGRLTASVLALERAVALNREFGRAHRLLALAYWAMGKTELALRAARSGYARDRRTPGPAFPGEALMSCGTPDRGVAARGGLKPARRR